MRNAPALATLALLASTGLASAGALEPSARPALAPTRSAAALPAAAPSAARPFTPKIGTRALVMQAAARLKLGALRAATLPAHFWPFNRVAAAISHGEPFTGMTPASATREALKIAAEGGKGTTIGRLAPTLGDIWSVRGAEKSFMKLIDGVAQAKAKNPRVDASIAFDPDSFGYGLHGVSQADRERTAETTMMRIAAHAKARGVPLEMDMTTTGAMPFTVAMARKIVTELKVPVRMAIPARYEVSEKVLADWAQLAKDTGIKLGVRLVKGSYVEANAQGTIDARKPLIDHYKKMITLALGHAQHLDVAVASHNEEIYAHAQQESARLRAPFVMHNIRGVNPTLQAKMRKDGTLAREYVSYGVDAPVFGLDEMITTIREKRAIAKRVMAELD